MKNLEYAPIVLTDNNRYKQHLSLCKDVPADYSTALIWGYSHFYPTGRAYADGLCWQNACEHGVTLEYAPLGDWDSIDWPAVFDKYVTPGTAFGSIPGILKEQWESIFPGRFEIRNTRDEWDYIYDLNGFATDTESKRRLLKNFHERYEHTVVPITSANIGEVLAISQIAENRILEESDRSKDMFELEEDDEAMGHILEKWDVFDSIDGFMIRVGGKYISYMIWDVVDDRIICLFNKNIYGFVGVHEAAVEELCRINISKGRRWVNYTCDAGFEGLRKAKMIRNPVRLMEKYQMVWMG